MKKILIFLIATMISLCISAQKDDNAIFDQICKATESTKTVRCDFRQTRQSRMLREKVVSTGSMCYQQPGKLRWEYKTPYISTFIIDGDKAVMYRNGKKSVVDMNRKRAFREIASLMMNSVLGKNLRDEKVFKSTVEEKSAEWTVSMVPQQKEMKRMCRSLILHIDRKDCVIKKIEMEDRNADITVIELNNIEKNPTLKQGTFE